MGNEVADVCPFHGDPVRRTQAARAVARAVLREPPERQEEQRDSDDATDDREAGDDVAVQRRAAAARIGICGGGIAGEGVNGVLCYALATRATAQRGTG